MVMETVTVGKPAQTIMGEQISKLREKLSQLPTNWSMQKTVDGRQNLDALTNNMSQQKRSMSMIKEAQDPFMNKRQTVPSVFLHELTTKDRDR